MARAFPYNEAFGFLVHVPRKGLSKMNVRRVVAACAVVVLAAASVIVTAQGTPPGAPSNLNFQVNGSNVWLNWISSPGLVEDRTNPAAGFYRLEAASGPGAPAFFTWDSSQNVDPNKMPHMLAAVGPIGAPAGTYYVRVRGINGGVAGPVSNEIVVPVTGGCQAPGAPTDFTAITRGSTVYLAWNPGNGGLPTSYLVHASFESNGPVIAALGTSTPYLNVGGVPNGTYYVRVYASTACGTSAASNEIVVTAPNGAAAVRTPNAASGKLPWFYVRDLVIAAGQEAASLGLMNGAVSCPTRSGWPDSEIEARKVQRNPYIDHVVARLRQFDPRFGYNAKPTRSQYNAIVAGDEIAYHWGSDAPEGSPNVYLIDTFGGHCTFGRESVDFRPFSNEYGRWTAAGAF